MRDKLQNLLEFVRDTDLTEVLWSVSGDSIHLTRSVKPAVAATSVSNATAAVSGEAPTAPEPMLIRSKMVGTFYRSDAKKNRPPLVIEGTTVTAGQPVGAVEAMKIMKDVIAPEACKIVKALVENGHAVEYGQPLFEVAPPDAVEAPHV